MLRRSLRDPLATALGAPQIVTQSQASGVVLDALQIGDATSRGFREQRSRLVVNWTSCATFFARFSPDSPLHDGLNYPPKAKSQVSLKQVGLF